MSGASQRGGGRSAAGNARTGARHRLIKIAAHASTGVEATMLWRRAHRIAGNVVVRCREGHAFTTIWIPGASLKSLRFGFWRFQHCPVGHHWSLVTPVKESDLTVQEKRTASEHEDIRIP